jgi:hypothetical protein
MNHDAFVDILSYWLAKASIPHKGGWRGRPRSCKGLFTHIAHQINLLTDNEEKPEKATKEMEVTTKPRR